MGGGWQCLCSTRVVDIGSTQSQTSLLGRSRALRHQKGFCWCFGAVGSHLADLLSWGPTSRRTSARVKLIIPSLKIGLQDSFLQSAAFWEANQSVSVVTVSLKSSNKNDECRGHNVGRYSGQKGST